MAAWVLTRVVMLVLLATPFEGFVVGDVLYYHGKIARLFEVGLAGTLVEYPTPVVWILWLPYGLTLGSQTGYLVAYIVFMLLLDAAFGWALWRADGRRHRAAVDFWLLFVFLMGPLTYLRFDLLTAVLAGGALLAARRHPWATGALTGLGAAVKLWPALLIPAFLSHRPDRRPAGIAFVVVGFGLAGLSLLTGGWVRLVSPLTWQSDRGLQVESVWATPLMLARAFGPEQWAVRISRYQAYEIFGPGVEAWLVVSNAATLLGLAAIVALWVRAHAAGEPTPIGIGMVVVATVAIMIVTNKTLSPQYLLWLGGPVAVLLVLRRSGSAPEARAVRRLAVQVLVLAGLTHLTYPLLYDGLIGRSGVDLRAVSTAVTAVRNLALVLFTVEVCRYAWTLLPGRAQVSARRARAPS